MQSAINGLAHGEFLNPATGAEDKVMTCSFSIPDFGQGQRLKQACGTVASLELASPLLRR